MSDIPYELAMKALKAYSRTDKSGFAPSIGQLIGIIKPPVENALAAWEKVRRAIRNSAYNSESEFAMFPDDIKRAVGSAGQLKAWGMMNNNDVETIAQAQFIKTYNMEVQRAIKTPVPQIAPPDVPQITATEKVTAPEDLIDRFKAATGERRTIEDMYLDDVREIEERVYGRREDN